MTDYILSPVPEKAPAMARAQLAPRPASLDGKRIGLLDDKVTRSIGSIGLVRDVVQEHWAPCDAKVWVKPSTGRPAPVALMQEVERSSDVVILASAA